jgi:hypothetical protein
MALGRGQTTEVGAYANQRLNLAKLGRPMEEMPWFRTGPGKTGRPGLSGGPAKRSHGGIVNPPCNRKGKCGNPAPTAGARGFYPNQGEHFSSDTFPTLSWGERVTQVTSVRASDMLARYLSAIRAACANERSCGSARGAISNGGPYRDPTTQADFGGLAVPLP